MHDHRCIRSIPVSWTFTDVSGQFQWAELLQKYQVSSSGLNFYLLKISYNMIYAHAWPSEYQVSSGGLNFYFGTNSSEEKYQARVKRVTGSSF